MKTIRYHSLAIIIGMLICWIVPSNICASVKIDGIYYDLNTSSKTATVAFYQTNYYSGSIVIPASIVYNGRTYSVTSIGNSVFSDCTGLTSVTIPNSVTSIGDGSFAFCTSLHNVTIPNNVTSIGSCAFQDCTGLYSVTLGTSLTSIGGTAFKGCSHLKLLSIPNSVITIGPLAFGDCTSLTSLEIPNSVTSIGNQSFWNCTGLTSLKIGDGVIEIGESAFNNCSGLTSVTIPNSVTTIGSGAFNDCTGLSSISIGSSVTSIGNFAFGGCTNISVITMMSKNHLPSITEYSFETATKNSCTLYIPGNLPWVELLGNWSEFKHVETYEPAPEVIASGSCGVNVTYSVYSDMTMVISGTGPMYNYNLSFDNEEGTYYVYGGSRSYWEQVKNVVIEEGVTSIGNYAFWDCDVLASVTFPNSLTEIGCEAFENTPWYINKPDGLLYAGKLAYKYKGTMPDDTELFIKEGTLHIHGSIFSGCLGLTSVTIPNSVISIGSGAFSGCSGLTSVTMPNGVTNIGSDAFLGCEGLTCVNIHDLSAWYQINFANAYSNPLTYARHLYYNGEVIDNITIPNTVTSIGAYSFYNCSGLTSLEIPESVTSIGQSAFYGCESLTCVNIHDLSAWYQINFANVYSNPLTYARRLYYNGEVIDNITIPNTVTSIGAYSFYNCSGLTSLEIPESVTSIGQSAFYGCEGLTSLEIPRRVTSISSDAFSGCTGLTSIKVGWTSPKNVDFLGVDKSTCTLYVPRGLTWAYQEAQNWRDFQNIEEYGDIVLLAKGSCGNNLTYTIYSDMTMVISGSGPMWRYYSEGEEEDTYDCINEAYYQLIKNVIIEDGVTSISSYAFGNYISLTSVTIPNSVTSIGYIAFSRCTSLISVEIPYSVTSIDNNAFYGCTGLTSVTISNGVTSIGDYAFSGCTGLTSITIPSSVTSTGSAAFSGCTGLATVNILSGVTSFGDYSFSGCTGLTTVTIPSTTIGNSVFYGCTGLATVTFLNGVTSIDNYAFCRCTGLTSVEIPNSVTSIGSYAFSGCTALASITVDAGNTVLDSRDNCNAIIKTATNELFLGCKTTDIPNSVTTIGDYAFSGRTGLTSVKIPNSVTSIGSSAFLGCTGLTSITIPSSVTSIGSSAFSGCTGLTSIDIPNSVTSIGSSAFSGCTGLTSVAIPNGVTSIGDDVFKGCTGLTTVEIPNSVMSIGRSAFSGCTGLTSMDIPSSVTNIGSYAFSGCKGLTSMDIPSCVTDIGSYAFSSCTGLTSVTVSNGVRSIGDHSFSGCTGLTSITIPSSVTSIGSSAFSGCTDLTSVTIPSSVTSIGSSTFSGCTGLTSIDIPNSVTSIGDYSFSGCTGLTSVDFPNSVTYIGECAFRGCTGLNSIMVERETPASIQYSAFLYVDKTNCTLYVPTGSKWAYERKTGWSEFQNIVEYTPAPIVLATGSCGDNVSYTLYSDMSMVISGTGEMWDYSYDTHINDDYYQSIKSVIIEDGVTHIGKDAFCNCTSLTSITIPNSVTEIGWYAFEDCSSLTSIEIPNSVTSIGVYAFDNTAWYNNQPDGLIYINNIAYTYKGEMPEGTSITLRDGTIIIAAYAFSGHSGLTSIMIPNSVTTIGEYAFRGCTRLASVTFPNSLFIIGYNAFEETAWLDNQPEGLVYAGNVVYSYKGDEGYGISNDLIVNEGTLGIMPEVFFRDDRYNDQDDRVVSIASISLPSTLVYLQPLLSYIPSGDVFFRRSCLLSSMDVEAITVDANNPVYDSRDNCNAIIETSTNKLIIGSKSTIIPNGVTTIGAYTLGQLTSVTIPSSVNLIENCAFCPEYYHRELKEDLINTDDEDLLELLGDWYVSSPIETIRMEGLIPPSAAFTSVNTSTCILYVPAGSKSAYENAEGWREFENIVEYEPDTDISTLDNAIYVEQTEGRIGGTKDISVKMKNDFDVRGFQFSMELPEGSTINSWTLNQGRMPAGTTMNKVFATEGIDENKINVVCALNDGEKTFTGNDGLIATVNVTFAEDMEEGSYPIYLTHNSISDATAQTQLVLSNIKSTLVLEDYVLGDTNGDGMVLVGDVIAILNYIVGSPSNNFNAKAADVNGDGKILVGDVIAVLNIIVNQ